MKILLIYPEYPDTFWSFKHALKFIDRKAAFPPLGLLTVSSLLPKSWEKKLIDLNVTRLKDSDLDWADYVFVSGMIVQRLSAKEVIDRAKSRGKFVVAGGPLFTDAYNEYENVDCFVLNEGEITLPLFLEDLERNNLQHIYTSKEKPDISLTPLPNWSLINMNNYSSLAVQTSRGCPFDCDFCDIVVLNGRVPRVKSKEQVIAEFDALYQTGWRGGVFIVDDNFIGNKFKTKQILRELIPWMDEKGKPFTLTTEAPITLADDPELLDLMKQTNFNSVFIGIETPEEEGLKSCGKFQNTKKDMVEKVKILQNNGFDVMGGFILGFDTDTSNTFDNVIKFIQQSGIVTAMVGLLHALPETKFYHKMQEAGRLIASPTGNNTDHKINFKPIMKMEELIEGYRKVQETIFSPKFFNKRIIVYLREYKRTAKESNLTVKQRAKALTKTIWKLGIRERGKMSFWKMFLWTIFRKPRLLPNAVTLSIYGYHFRTVMIKNEDY